MRVDESYIPDVNQRLTVYRRVAAVRNEADLDRIMDEVRDRYGPPPDSVLNLAEYAAIRLMADRLRLAKRLPVHRAEDDQRKHQQVNPDSARKGPG